MASGLSAILMLLISIPAVLLADRVPRRHSMLTGGSILTFCMFAIGTLYALDSVSPSSPTRFLVVILVFVFGLAYSATWGISGKIYASEIQPPATRSAASCVAQGLGFFTNFVVAMITPVLLASSSFGAYFLFGGVCAVSVGVLMVSMPETRGLSLEDIQVAFARPAAVGGRGRVVSLLRRWAGVGGSAAAAAASVAGAGGGGSDGSDSLVELRDVLAGDATLSGTEALSLEDGSARGVRV